MANMKLALCIFVLHIHSCYTDSSGRLWGEDLASAQKILRISADIIKDSNVRVGELLTEHKQVKDSASFEVGYLTFVVHEKFRRMIDKYNTSHTMRTRLYLAELVLYLGEIERHYWELNHISSMLHEVERKYGVTTDLNITYLDTPPPTKVGSWPEHGELLMPSTPPRKRTTFNIRGRSPPVTPATRYRPRQNWWTGEYGWEPKHQWFPDDWESLWKVKNNVWTTVATAVNPKRSSIINELSWNTRIKILKECQKDIPLNRRVGISFLRTDEGTDKPRDGQAKRSDESSTKSEDNSIKIKLFRLMYETVRDSDLKVRRSELIKDQYNTSVFEIGFLMGDVTDKVNVMNDISTTLTKMYAEWRAIEHINAYEQIANKAIEISHLLDVVRVVYKKVPKEYRPGIAGHGGKDFPAEK